MWNKIIKKNPIIFGISALLLILLSITIVANHVAMKRANRRWEELLNRLKKRGFRTSTKHLITPCRHEENAAVYLNKAKSVFEVSDQAERALLQCIHEGIQSLGEEEKDYMRQAFAKNREAIDYLEKASRCRFFQNNEDCSKPIYEWEGVGLAGTSNMLHYLIVPRAKLAADDGDLARAMDIGITGIKFARVLTYDHSFIGLMFDLVWMQRNYDLLHCITSGKIVPKAQTREIIELLEQDSFRQHMIDVLDFQRLLWLELVEASVEDNAIARNYYLKYSGSFPIFSFEIDMSSPVGWVISKIYLNTPVLLNDGIYVQEKHVEMIEAGLESFQKAKEVFLDIEQETKKMSQIHFIPQFSLTYLVNMLEDTMQAIARSRITCAALACKLYYNDQGHYPETLEDLSPGYLEETPEDPATGAPLKYQRFREGGFVIYGVGKNGKDDCTVSSTYEDFKNLVENVDDILWLEPRVKVPE